MAEKNSNNPLLYIILLLILLNLSLTGSLWLTRDESHTESGISKAGLPTHANDVALANLANRFTVLYNDGSTSAFFSEFDELAKTLFTEEDLERQLGQFANLVGKIESAAYSHHDASQYGDFPAFLLHYRVRLTGGPFTSGTMKISVIDRGDSFGLMGFNINGSSSTQ